MTLSRHIPADTHGRSPTLRQRELDRAAQPNPTRTVAAKLPGNRAQARGGVSVWEAQATLSYKGMKRTDATAPGSAPRALHAPIRSSAAAIHGEGA